jgi:hypothetical protein
MAAAAAAEQTIPSAEPAEPAAEVTAEAWEQEAQADPPARTIPEEEEEEHLAEVSPSTEATAVPASSSSATDLSGNQALKAYSESQDKPTCLS